MQNRLILREGRAHNYRRKLYIPVISHASEVTPGHGTVGHVTKEEHRLPCPWMDRVEENPSPTKELLLPSVLLYHPRRVNFTL